MDRTIDGSGSMRRRLITGAAAAGASAALLNSSNANAHGIAMGRVCNVLDHGVLNDGATDCTTNLRDLIANPTWDVFYFPAGRYFMSGPATNGAALTRSERTLVIYGDGPQATELIWQHDGLSDSLIKWSTTDTGISYDRLEVRDITLRAVGSIGTAISGTKFCIAPQLRQQALIQNVEIIGEPAVPGVHAAYYFNTGIKLDGLENCKINALTATFNFVSGTTGVEISSPPNPQWCSMAQLHQLAIFNADWGVKFTGYEQGLMLTDSNIAGCKLGVFTPMTADGMPGVNIHGCHFNCWFCGIGLDNMCQAMISDNLIYLTGGDEGLIFGIHVGQFALGVQIEKDIIISNNIIGAPSVYPSPPYRAGYNPVKLGVYMPGSDARHSVLVADNMFNNLTVGVQMDANTRGAFVANTNRYRACITNVGNSGANTVQP